MSIAYKIRNNYDFITCIANANALVASEITVGNSGLQNQVWQFIAMLGLPNTYYLRNINDVYLRAIGASVTAGNIGNASQWVLVPTTPITTPPTFKIQLKDDNTKYLTIQNNTVVLGSESIAVNWDILEHDEHGNQ